MTNLNCPHCSEVFNAEQLTEHLVTDHDEDVEDAIKYVSTWSPLAKEMDKVLWVPPYNDVLNPVKKSSNPKLDIGSKKLGFQAIPPSAIAFLAQAMNDGAKKYGGRNWRDSKVVMSIYLDAMLRHLLCVMDGDDIAEDSKLEHLAHIMANCAIVLDAKIIGNLEDDRFTSGNVSDIIGKINGI